MWAYIRNTNFSLGVSLIFVTHNVAFERTSQQRVWTRYQILSLYNFISPTWNLMMFPWNEKSNLSYCDIYDQIHPNRMHSFWRCFFILGNSLAILKQIQRVIDKLSYGGHYLYNHLSSANQAVLNEVILEFLTLIHLV